jgi:hypothetical protein
MTHELKPKQAEVIALLLAGRTQREAAESAGVSIYTISRWRHKDPIFIASLNEGRRSLYEAGVADLLDARREAIQALREMIADERSGNRWQRLRAVELALRYSPAPAGMTDPEQIQGQFESAREMEGLLKLMRLPRTKRLRQARLTDGE